MELGKIVWSEIELIQLGTCVDILKMTQTLQKFVSIKAPIQNHFNHERHLESRQTYKQKRSAALIEWFQIYAS